MIQVKTFQVSYSTSELDDTINDWLRSHQNIKVEQMSKSSYISSGDYIYHTVTILYNDNVSGIDKL